MQKLYLVDVSSMYFRAYYAVRPLSNKAGMPTNALYGFLQMAVKLLKDVRPDYMAFCFDRKEPSFRKEMFDGYKANRSEMPEDLVPQVPYVRALTEALGIPAYDKQSFEADDIIGTLTRIGRQHNLEVVIVSGDKDFAQLVENYVTMYDTMKDVKYDVQGVIEKWGVEPQQVIDYLALVGDSSDNIPGVRGIGPKGAQKLLAEYRTLDGIYENIESIKNAGLKAKLVENKENAYLSKKLVEIKKDIAMGIQLEDLKLKPLPEQQLRKLLDELDFKSFEKRIFGHSLDSQNTISSSSEKLVKSNDHQVNSAKTGTSTTNSVYVVPQQGELFAMTAPSRGNEADITELTPEMVLTEFQDRQVLWALPTDRGLYVSTLNQKIYRLSGELNKLADSFGQKKIKWKGYKLKDFWHTLGVSFDILNMHAPMAQWDSSLAAYVVRAGDVGAFEECFQKMTGAQLPELASPQQLLSAHLTLEKILKEKVEALSLDKVLRELDLPLEQVLYSMERRGIKVDAGKLHEQSQKTEKDLRLLEKEIFQTTGHSFNLTSPKQLSDVLFNKLKMPVIKKTKTGFSTDSDVLLKLSQDYPVCLMIIEHRELSKLKSTYLDSLPHLINPSTGRIHTRFHQSVTTTGRLSSTHPNLQNIPIRTPRGAMIREAFTVPEGSTLVSADYSQIELRILAHISKDPALCAAFHNDLDIHAATAAEVFEIPLKNVTSEQRRVAKAVNFGIAYGMSAFGLSENLNIPVEEASQIIKKYFTQFAKIRDYMEETVEQAKNKGYVETLFGRRRYLDELKSSNANVRKFGERAAINAPMQGTAADIVKKAMLEVEQKVPGTMLLQVHDELVFEIKNQSVEEFSKTIKETMERVVELSVPLKVNIASGANWDAAH